jgi:uncharacterized protein (DUF1330 family)
MVVMAAYLIALVDITDPEAYRDYAARSPAAIAKYNGRILARGGQVATLEGDAFSGRAVIVEFPSMQDIQEFYSSPEYQDAKRWRDGAAVARFIIVQGVEACIGSR